MTLKIFFSASLITLLSFTAMAQGKEGWLNQGLSWMQSALPENGKLSFTRNKFKIPGSKQKQYQLIYQHRLSQYWQLQGKVNYAKYRYYIGGQNQSIKSIDWSFIPRLQLGDGIKLGFGLKRAMSPKLNSQNINAELPRSQTLLINTEFESHDQGSRWLIEISRRHWQAKSNHPDWFKHNQVDNKISLDYQWQF